MILGDIILEQQISTDELRSAMAKALALSEEGVAVITDIKDATAMDGAIVDITQLSGQFSMQLGIYVKSESSANLTDVAAKLAQLLAVQVLVPSDSENPYEMILIRKDGSSSMIYIDTYAIDELGEYRISSVP